MTGIESKVAIWVLKQAYSAVQSSLSNENKGPVEAAVQKTCEHFSQFDGLGETLRLWIASGSISEALGRFLAGLDGVEDVPLELLVSSLIRDGGFYLADSTAEEARGVVLAFINALRDAVLALPNMAILFMENRHEARHREVMAALTSSGKSVSPFLALGQAEPESPILKQRFDRAKAALESAPKEAALLLEVLAEELRVDTHSSKTLLVKAVTNHANALLRLGEVEKSCELLKEAHGIEESSLTKLNLGVVALLENKPEECLSRLNPLESTSADKPEFWAAKLTALSRLDQNLEAVDIARHLPQALPESDRTELLGIALLNAGEFTEA
jgi:tetratricopeptide (TPR) repeat protein